MKRIFIWLLALTALTAAVAGAGKILGRTYGAQKTTAQYTLVLRDQEVTVTTSAQKNLRADRTVQRRVYQLANGDTVMQARVEGGKWASRWAQVEQWDLAAHDGTIWYFDSASGLWCTQPLAPVTLGTTAMYVQTDATDFFIYLPQGYRLVANECLQMTGSQGYVTLEQSGDGYCLRLFSSCLTAGGVCDYTVVISDAAAPLMDTSAASWSLWKNYAQPVGGKWCYDGYYRPCPDSYTPHGDGVYFRSVISYLTRLLVSQADSNRCADDLSIAMLDTIAQLQEADGSMHTKTASGWLQTDYGIGADYYDTRWNSDAMLLYLEFAARHGGFQAQMEAYLAFYLDYAEKYHYTTAHGGWFVYDYCDPQTGVAVHTSLNHQLSQMQVLYDYSDYLQEPELAELADRMLLAIEDTWQQWIRSDGDLHYCYLPDGSYGLQDYPYLTYNDLFLMQETLIARTGTPNTAIAELMQAKQIWMDQNGIKDYLKK